MDQLKLALIQPDLEWQDAAANRLLLEQALDEVIEDSDLILLPEMFTSAFAVGTGAIAEPWPGETVDWMRKMSSIHNAALCGSVAVTDQGRKLNRLVFVTPEGELHYYDKRHLFRMLGEDKRYAGGESRMTLTWRGWNIYPLVCYDLRFPVWCRNTPDLSYDLLLYVANWPAARNQHWQTLLKARAIENLAFVAGVNRIGCDGNNIDYIGHSMVVDPKGETLLDAGEEAGQYSATISKLELDSYREAFPAHLDADLFDLR